MVLAIKVEFGVDLPISDTIRYGVREHAERVGEAARVLAGVDPHAVKSFLTQEHAAAGDTEAVEDVPTIRDGCHVAPKGVGQARHGPLNFVFAGTYSVTLVVT